MVPGMAGSFPCKIRENEFGRSRALRRAQTVERSKKRRRQENGPAAFFEAAYGFFLLLSFEKTTKTGTPKRPQQTVKKVIIRLRRRTCADDGDTAREILRQIVCEELCSECAICRKILSKGFSKGEIDALGAAVRGCCPFCSVSSFSTR